MTDLTARKLKQARDLVNNSPEFRKLGSVDARMGIKVGKSAYLVVFKGFCCDSVSKLNLKDIREADFVIEMSADMWERFLSGCHSNNGPTVVQLDTTDKVVKTGNPREKLEFLRYHNSFQAFFEAYASLEQKAA